MALKVLYVQNFPLRQLNVWKLIAVSNAWVRVPCLISDLRFAIFCETPYCRVDLNTASFPSNAPDRLPSTPHQHLSRARSSGKACPLCSILYSFSSQSSQRRTKNHIMMNRSMEERKKTTHALRHIPSIQHNQQEI